MNSKMTGTRMDKAPELQLSGSKALSEFQAGPKDQNAESIGVLPSKRELYQRKEPQHRKGNLGSLQPKNGQKKARSGSGLKSISKERHRGDKRSIEKSLIAIQLLSLISDISFVNDLD
jgi:hypothetical protein